MLPVSMISFYLNLLFILGGMDHHVIHEGTAFNGTVV